MLVLATMLVGFGLRSYQLDFPSIGYHNMNENETLGIAQEMMRTNDFINRRVYFNNAFENDTTVRNATQVPLVAYQTIAAWKLFGENLQGPRQVNVLFGTASILLVYALAFLLFGTFEAALFSSFVFAILPLTVFFSRNLQAESPALFFMLLGTLAYVRFSVTFKKLLLFLGGVFFSIAFFYRVYFLIGLLPCLWVLGSCLRARENNDKAKIVVMFFLPYALFSAVVAMMVGKGYLSLSDIIQTKAIFSIFTFAFWNSFGQTLWWYFVGENFTVVFAALTIVGVGASMLKSFGLVSRFISGGLVSLVVYGMLFSVALREQNYAQMPFAPLVSIASTLGVLFLTEIFEKFKVRNLKAVVMVVVILLAAPFVRLSLQRMQVTIFPGEDVAGSTLRELTKQEERVFLFTNAQGNGIARYARRYMGWPANLKDFQEKEAKFGIRYLCVYPFAYVELLSQNDPELFKYIQDHYRIKEVGFLGTSDQLYYLILEKGKGGNLLEALKTFSGPLQTRAIYRVAGRHLFFYSVRAQEG